MRKVVLDKIIPAQPERIVQDITYECELCDFKTSYLSEADTHNVRSHSVKARAVVKTGEWEYKLLRFDNESDFLGYTSQYHLYNAYWKGPGWYFIDDVGDYDCIISLDSEIKKKREEAEENFTTAKLLEEFKQSELSG